MNFDYITEQIVWIGTQAQFDLLLSLSENVIYFIVEG